MAGCGQQYFSLAGYEMACRGVRFGAPVRLLDDLMILFPVPLDSPEGVPELVLSELMKYPGSRHV